MTPSPNNKHNDTHNSTMASYQHEGSSLLPTIASSGKSDSENTDGSDDYDDDELFPALDERRDSFSTMKKVVHNDPTFSKQYESAEDFQKLLGSTSLLKNGLDQSQSVDAALARRRQKRSSSFSMVLPSTKEADLEDMSGLSFRHTDSTRLNRNVNSFNGLSMREKMVKDSMRDENDNYFVFSHMRSMLRKQISQPSTLYLKKIKTSFFDDAKSLAEGTIPQSVVLATVIGIVCGIACYIYYSVLYFFLDYLWDVLPEEYVIPSDKWSPEYYWLWIPLVAFAMVTFVGLTVVYMGEPGDLPYTISRVHCEAYIPMNHVFPMVFASIFSILGKSIVICQLPFVNCHFSTLFFFKNWVGQFEVILIDLFFPTNLCCRLI